jgi:SAM-dependent methyltransferase
MSEIKSYSSENASAFGLLREARSLYRWHARCTSERALASIEDARFAEGVVKDDFGIELVDRDVLDVGPGQFLTHMTYFSTRNRVVGIDLDVIIQGFSPLGYIRMLRTNGLTRAAKTIGRKVLGVDRKVASDLRHLLHIERRPSLTVLQMDACAMSFPLESFDFVYSRAVFHHLPRPDAAIDAVVRILRPGGACFITLHPYTSPTGCLDPRIYTEKRNEVQGWPHLRRSLQGQVDPSNACLNRLRLPEWRALFTAKMPGVRFILTESKDATIGDAEALHSQGELLNYSLEELCTGQFAAVWKKPGGSNTGHPPAPS